MISVLLSNLSLTDQKKWWKATLYFSIVYTLVAMFILGLDLIYGRWLPSAVTAVVLVSMVYVHQKLGYLVREGIFEKNFENYAVSEDGDFVPENSYEYWRLRDKMRDSRISDPSGSSWLFEDLG